jgi:hypothetical protein
MEKKRVITIGVNTHSSDFTVIVSDGRCATVQYCSLLDGDNINIGDFLKNVRGMIGQPDEIYIDDNSSEMTLKLKELWQAFKLWLYGTYSDIVRIHCDDFDEVHSINQNEKALLVDFMKYLNRRGFMAEDLQCDIEHQVETYLKQFKFKQQ